MTVQELEQVEKNMQQQWRNLVVAEQQGAALETLEQMYDTYILLAEEYNRCSEQYQHEQQRSSATRAPLLRGGKKQPFLGRDREQGRGDPRGRPGSTDIKLAS